MQTTVETPTEYWIVTSTALEYDDENYHAVDGVLVPEKIYLTEEDAKAAIADEYKRSMEYICLHEMKEWYWPDGGAWLRENTPYDIDEWDSEVTVNNVIDYCEEHCLDWKPNFPNFVHVYKVEVAS